MASRLPSFDPDVKLPFALKLAQFLLGASDQLGQYGQGMQRQSAGAADILESQGRQDIQRDVLAERRREADLKTAAAERAGREEQGLQTFFGRLRGASDPLTAVEGLTVPREVQLEALKGFLAGKKDTRPATVSPGAGVLNRETGKYDVPLPVPEKPEPITAERTAGLAARALRKQERGEPLTTEESEALDTHNLKAGTAVKVSAATGREAALRDIQPADAGPAAPAGSSMERNPDYREGGVLSVPKTSSVAQAAIRDLGAPGAPAPGGRGQTVIERKTELEETTRVRAKAAATLDQPLGADASNWIDRETGLPVHPNTTGRQALTQAVPLSSGQAGKVAAAGRGLATIQGLRESGATALFPEAPFKGRGIAAVLGNAARARVFKWEAALRSMSDGEFADFRTRVLSAIPTLARAAGDVGNLSAVEQQRVQEALGMARTREAFAAGIKAYEDSFRRAYEANGVPVPRMFRSNVEAGPSAPAQPGAPPGFTPRP